LGEVTQSVNSDFGGNYGMDVDGADEICEVGFVV
jgi:hypothetical protein